MNKALKRGGGRIFADHYHSHLLATPTEVRNALKYVSGNAGHHFGHHGIDWCSSQNPQVREVLGRPTTWPLRIGWQSGAASG